VIFSSQQYCVRWPISIELQKTLFVLGQHFTSSSAIERTYWFLCPTPSVRPSGYRYMVCSAISSYSFGATALIFCRIFIHIMEVCMSTGFWFSSNILKMTGSWTCHFVCPSGYRYMVCPAISSYSFGATALIFCIMFMHIMEVCMSTGFWFSSNIW
jgi:hypothetical protein